MPQFLSRAQEWFRARPSSAQAIIIVATILALLVAFFAFDTLTSAIYGPSGGGTPEEVQRAEERTVDEGPTTQPADPFAGGRYYTFFRKEHKTEYGDALILGVLAGSESASQIDKIAREVNYDKSKYKVVIAGVLTKNDLTEEQIEEMTREDETIVSLSNEDFHQAGVLVISNSLIAGLVFGILPGEHAYFASPEALEQAISESGIDIEEHLAPELDPPKP